MNTRPTLATIDEDFLQVERLLRQLRKRLASAAETARLVALERDKLARLRPRKARSARR